MAVRTDHGWRFAALHNSRVRPVRIPEPDSLPARASHLIARLLARRGPARVDGSPVTVG